MRSDRLETGDGKEGRERERERVGEKDSLYSPSTIQ
jgi:hypothetical protein